MVPSLAEDLLSFPIVMLEFNSQPTNNLYVPRQKKFSLQKNWPSVVDYCLDSLCERRAQVPAVGTFNFSGLFMIYITSFMNIVVKNRTIFVSI